MRKVDSMDEVFAAMQKVKSHASAYCTNFFQVPKKLQSRIEQGDLFLEESPGAAFFFSADHDFWRIHFCAAGPDVLKRQFNSLPALKTEPLVIDILEQENQTEGILTVIKSIGFRPYARLCRLTRNGSAQPAPNSSGESQAVCAAPEDVPNIFELIDSSFDRYAEQIPKLSDIELAVKNRHILIVKHDQTVAGLLYFETQGTASTIRYWLVAQKFRALNYGSMLMRSYLAAHGAIKRFTLWVMADNAAALQKYQHYGYTSDKLTDHVLVNEIIRHETSH